MTSVAGWADMDFNGHMANTAYLDKAADTRMTFFAEHGFAVDTFTRQRIGPVIMRDEVRYFREVGLQQRVEIRLLLAGMAGDGSRFRLRNEFYLDGEPAARVESLGGWMDLTRRKLVCPPEALLGAMNKLVRTEDFEELTSSIRG